MLREIQTHCDVDKTFVGGHLPKQPSSLLLIPQEPVESPCLLELGIIQEKTNPRMWCLSSYAYRKGSVTTYTPKQNITWEKRISRLLLYPGFRKSVLKSLPLDSVCSTTTLYSFLLSNFCVLWHRLVVSLVKLCNVFPANAYILTNTA